MPDSSTDPPTLEYGRRAPLAWVSRHRRGLVVLALVVAAAIPVGRNWPALKRRALWLYWSDQAAKHVMPADPDGRLARSYRPNEYVELSSVDPRATLAGSNGPIVFMGLRHRPDGTPRLVILAGTAGDSWNLLGGAGAVALPMPSWNDPLPAAVTPPMRFVFGSGPPPQAAELGLGRADPRDPTRIIVPYSILAQHWAGGQIVLPNAQPGSGEIDLFLQDDDSFRLILRGPGSLDSAPMLSDPQLLDAEGRRWRDALNQPVGATRPAVR